MRIKIILAALCLSTLSLLSCQGLTEFARPFVLSDEDEITIGKKFKAQIIADTKTYPEYKKDTAVINYINRMGKAIADKQSDRKTIPFSFTIIDDTVVNAFALPGGPIFIYKGLLKKAVNGAEVAGVLAHEIGHIAKFHGANRMVQANGVSMINQILFGDDTTVTKSVASGLQNLLLLRYSRDAEFQADSCAVAYTTAAKYNPYGMKTFLGTLLKLYGDNPLTFLAEHPATSDRVEKVDALINKLSPVPSSTDSATLRTAEYEVIKKALLAP